MNSNHKAARSVPLVLEDTGVPEDVASAAVEQSRAIFTEFPLDSVTCVLSRSQALVSLLLSDGDGASFTLQHKSIVNALWLLEGQLEQMRLLVEAYQKGQEVLRNGTLEGGT